MAVGFNLLLPLPAHGWGLLTHAAIAYEAIQLERISTTGDELDAFLLGAIAADLISKYHVRTGADRFDYAHNLIAPSDRSMNPGLDPGNYFAEGPDQTDGLPIFGRLMVDSARNRGELFFAAGWLAHQVSERRAHGSKGFSNTMSPWTEPINLVIDHPWFAAIAFGSYHALNEVGVDALSAISRGRFTQVWRRGHIPDVSRLIAAASVGYVDRGRSLGAPLGPANIITNAQALEMLSEFNLFLSIYRIMLQRLADDPRQVASITRRYSGIRTAWYDPSVHDVQKALQEIRPRISHDLRVRSLRYIAFPSRAPATSATHLVSHKPLLAQAESRLRLPWRYFTPPLRRPHPHALEFAFISDVARQAIKTEAISQDGLVKDEPLLLRLVQTVAQTWQSSPTADYWFWGRVINELVIQKETAFMSIWAPTLAASRDLRPATLKLAHVHLGDFPARTVQPMTTSFAAASGTIMLGSIRVSLNGRPVSERMYRFDPLSGTVSLLAPLEPDNYALAITAKDILGRDVSQTWSFRIQP